MPRRRNKPAAHPPRPAEALNAIEQPLASIAGLSTADAEQLQQIANKLAIRDEF